MEQKTKFKCENGRNSKVIGEKSVFKPSYVDSWCCQLDQSRCHSKDNSAKIEICLRSQDKNDKTFAEKQDPLSNSPSILETPGKAEIFAKSSKCIKSRKAMNIEIKTQCENLIILREINRTRK